MKSINHEAALTIKAVAQPTSIRKYVIEHRKEIDAQLKQHVPDLKRPNDQDRINWVRCTQKAL